MQKARPLAGTTVPTIKRTAPRTTMDLEWRRRSRLIHISLLAIGLTLGIAIGASIGMELGESGLSGSIIPATILVISGTWLLIAYLFSRARHHYLAGGMIVALVITILALTVYFLPDYTIALLPFVGIPLAFSALLLNRRSVYLTAVVSILALWGSSLAAHTIPAPTLSLRLPPADTALAFNMAVFALLFLALILAPLRGEITRLFAHLRKREIAQANAEQAQRSAENARDDALNQLERQQHHLLLVTEHIGDGIISVEEGQIIKANTTARSLWADVAAGELIGQRYDHLHTVLTGPTAAVQYVDIIELPDGNTMRSNGYTHVLLDQRERARLARLRSELLSLLADEMRNPLTSMVTALEMTLGQNLPDGADRVLVGARRSGQRLLELVTTMLEINQIEQNPAVLRRSPVLIRPILDAGIAQTAPLQHQGAVTVVVEYSGDGVVMIDSDRMRRAFVHLLEHALRHSPPYSTVQVRTECQSDALVVRISDQGPGLTIQQRELLFDQRNTTEERKTPALGLAYSKLVIETHGGRVMVESSGSQGSTYVFSLPMEKRMST